MTASSSFAAASVSAARVSEAEVPRRAWRDLIVVSMRGYRRRTCNLISSLIDPGQPTMPDPFVFPNGINASFVFGPHDRWRADFGGLFQRNTN